VTWSVQPLLGKPVEASAYLDPSTRRPVASGTGHGILGSAFCAVESFRTQADLREHPKDYFCLVAAALELVLEAVSVFASR